MLAYLTKIVGFMVLAYALSLYPAIVKAQNIPKAKTKNKNNEAQKEKKIRYIEDIYTYTRDKISKGQFYTDEYHVNTDSLTWHDSPSFQFAEYYYYSYLGQEPALRLYSQKMQKDKAMYYVEFLFDIDMTLLFCYQKQNLEEKYKYRELRAYFEKGVVSTLIIDDNITDYKESEHGSKIKDLLAEVQDCLRKFKEQGAVLHKY